MAQRRYGPTRGAGVVVIEKETSKQIEDSALGVTGYVGMLEKGPVGELIQCPSLTDFSRRCGGRIDASKLPDACQDFFNHSGGAGELNLIRVTDALEESAVTTLWTREGATKTQCMTVTAKNGGRWAGKLQVTAEEAFSVLAETTLTATALALAKNELAGATLKLDAVAATSYTVISNTAHATIPVITVAPGSTMSTDHAADPDEGWSAELVRDTNKEVYVLVGEPDIGDDATLFSLEVFCDGTMVKRWGDLSMDPTSKYYFLNLVNDDGSNYWITVADLLPGSGPKTAAMRPANWYGIIDGAPTATGATVTVFQHSTTTGDADPTITLGTITDAMMYPCTVRIVITAVATVTFDVFVTFPGGTEVQIASDHAIAGAFSGCPLVPPITAVDGATVFEVGDVVTLYYYPLGVDELIGHYVYPDYANHPTVRFRITDNDNKSITIVGGDLTDYAEDTDELMISAPGFLAGGYDGDTPAAVKFTDQLQTDNSPFNTLVGQKKGLAKLASPGVTGLLGGADAITVQKALVAYAEIKNWQARVEIPAADVTVADAIAYVNSDIGRNDFGVASFPSWGKVDDPDKSGQLKSVSLLGAIHGREAAMARNYDGYHKAAAGIGVTLFRVLRLNDGSSVGNPHTQFDEEQLNPSGIQMIKFHGGNCIVWGDRTVASDPGWKWKHQREMMSHYERTLGESFDFAIFEINDATIRSQLYSTLATYFLREYRKRALRGNTFEDACIIKVDAEINTAATMAAGELYAEIALQLADTVERFIITMTKDGVFERTS